MSVIVKIPETVNKDLQNERKKCTFNVEEMAIWWNSGAEKLKEKRNRENFFLSDPEIEDTIPSYYMSHKEKYEESIRKAVVVSTKIRNLSKKGMDGIDNYTSTLGALLGAGLLREGNPLSVHYVMFLPTIMGQGSSEQRAEWIGRAWNGEIIGTYAQTELGHGTFIRGLETTATYDPKTQEFVLNSPTITSFKWWPGGMGHTANYAVVIAQLYTQGACRGIFPFIVQLRDEDTHMPMPGIKIGEIGNKVGMNGVNNGFLGFEGVRIPRKNMLMKNAQVKEDGTFVKAPASILTYGTMMFVRVVIVRDMAWHLAKSATIAIRYSAVRRQSPINPNDPEPQILDHVMQQYKLFPVLSKAIVFKLVSEYIWDLYNAVSSELEAGDLERLPELHAMSCGLKAISTADASLGVEMCRLACGGHGYMSCATLSYTYGLATAAVTYEGENTVLLLQTARYLMKAWNQIINGAAVVPTVSYLQRFYKFPNTGHWDSSESGIIAALQRIAAGKISSAYENIEKRKKAGATHEEAANMTSIELCAAADAHTRAFMVEAGFVMIKNATKNVSPALGNVLNKIMDLYAVEACLRNLGDLLRFTKMTENDIKQLQIKLESTLTAIRPNSIGLVDGFDIPDGVLSSPLGAYDGNVYERIFLEALKSPLNQEPVNKSFEMYLKPYLKSNL